MLVEPWLIDRVKLYQRNPRVNDGSVGDKTPATVTGGDTALTAKRFGPRLGMKASGHSGFSAVWCGVPNGLAP